MTTHETRVLRHYRFNTRMDLTKGGGGGVLCSKQAAQGAITECPGFICIDASWVRLK